MQIGVAAGGPAADLSWRGRGVASPQDLAGFGIQRSGDRVPVFTAGDPAVDNAVIIQRRAGDPVAVLRYFDRCLPHLFAGLYVERRDIGVEPGRGPSLRPSPSRDCANRSRRW